MAIDAYLAEYLSLVSTIIGMAWGRALARRAIWNWTTAVVTAAVAVVVYLAPVVLLLSQSGDTGFESNKLLLLLTLNVVVLPGVLTYVPRVVKSKIRAKTGKSLP